MTLWLVLTWSVVRTIVVATLAVWIGRGLLRQINRVASAFIRNVWLFAAVVPLLIPELIVGFTYRLTAERLTESVWGTELLYATLSLVRSCAVSVFMQLLLPRSAVTRESVYSWRLLNRRDALAQWNYLRLLVTGPWRSPVVAWCLTALVTFQDFETAALVQVDRHPIVWTVWLFDANAGNQILSHSLRLIIAPVLVEILLLVPCLLLIGRSRDVSGGTSMLSHRIDGVITQPFDRWFAVAATLAGAALVVGWPVAVSLPELMSGMTALSGDAAGIVRQQTVTFGFSVTAAAIALSTVALLRRRNHSLLTSVCLAPGLAGSLALSLTLLWLFQLPGLRLLWDTWLPLLVGQSLLMLPRAWVLLLVLESVASVEALQSGQLLLRGGRSLRSAGTRILWRMSHLKWLAAVVVLCHWCTWDVTTASILRPVTVEPVVTRLYREMHFSRTESLTLLSLITSLTPVVVALLVVFCRRFAVGWWERPRGND
jgi:hypothetical protein